MAVHRVSSLSVLALLAGLLVLLPAPPAEAGGCAVPRNQTIRSLGIDFDQCYSDDYSIGGQSIDVDVYYLEDDLTSNTDRCLQGTDGGGLLDEPADTDLDGVPDRCEHKIADVDTPAGDNVLAVQAADETAMALAFYDSVGLDALGGETRIEVFIAEDPGNGGVPSGTRTNLDDEGIDRNDLVYGRAVVFHELQHLVQRFLGYTGATAFTSEGVARATQDRYDGPTDALNSWGFLSDANRLLRNLVPDDGSAPNGYRRETVDNVSYRGMSWWTWFMDTYTLPADTPPATGWAALADYYTELVAESDQIIALRDVIADRGSTFREDFIDYTLALWAHDYSPTDPRLGFDDTEYVVDTDAFDGHTVTTGSPALTTDSRTVEMRSSAYWELQPDSSCTYATYSFDSPSDTTFGLSVVGVDGGVASQRWTSAGPSWARAIPTAAGDRVVGVVTGLDDTGTVDVEWGCAQPEIDVTLPTTTALAYAGAAADPRRFIVRTEVTAGGAPIGGLLIDDFDVRLNLAGGGPDLPADIVTGAYTGEEYWLLVQAPSDADGAQTASLYDVTVTLGSASDTNPASVAYLERTLDRMIVLDRSGSMTDTAGKFEAAKNAASLMALELGGDDQGGLVTFSDAATLDVQLDELTAGQRNALDAGISGASAGGLTSIGAGIQRASQEIADDGVADHVCTYSVLSDGEENTPPLVADIEDQIIDDGCPIDAVAFGPDADEELMEDLSNIVAGGTYDYAPVSGQVPLAPDAPSMKGPPSGPATIGWENHLARVYDYAQARAAGRQRLLSTATTGADACGARVRLVDFADQQPGTRFLPGQSFTSGGVAVTAGALGDPPPRDAALEISRESGNGQAIPSLAATSAVATYDLGIEVCRVQMQFIDTSSAVRLTINDDTRDVDTILALDDQVVGGVLVDITTAPVPAFAQPTTTVGTITFTGTLSALSLGGTDLRTDDLTAFVGSQGVPIVVDASTDLLVVATSWQDPVGTPVTRLQDPGGADVDTALRRRSSNGIAEVWEVHDPVEGTYRLFAADIGQELAVNASARTDIALDLLPFPDGLAAGAEVPITTSFVDVDGPVLGGDVVAAVQRPDGVITTHRLYDDGDHGDGLADDGIYATTYQTGPQGDTLDLQGSYLVSAVGEVDGHRREAQASFSMAEGVDEDGDGLPDRWEEANGLDPDDRGDRGEDPDGDGLPNECELQAGTNPSSSDTDGGGLSDRAEIDPVTCLPVPGRNPNDPGDDSIGPLTGATIEAELDDDGRPVLVVGWGRPEQGELTHVELWCAIDSGPLVQVGPVRTGRSAVLTDVADGQEWRCQIRPSVTDSTGRVLPGRVLRVGPVTASDDPYPPVGSVVIDGGAPATTETTVELRLEVNDHVGTDEHDGGEGPVPGDAPGDIEMRLGNDEDLSGSPWQPFQAVVPAWDLGDVPVGETATVYVQFRDTAGNVSADGEGDTILRVGEERLEGPTRVETAIEISQADFPEGGAGAVVLARADDFPDAVAGTPLAVERGAPILLSQTGSLHPGTAEELQRVLPAGRTVYILGGNAALSPAVEQAVEALGYRVVRLAGASRFETAVEVAEALDGPGLAMVAVHDDFAAALAAGPAAGLYDGAILLSNGGRPHPATQAWLDDHPGVDVVAVGAPSADAHPEAEALVGGTREATAVAVAERFFPQPGAVGLATSERFADALTGGPHMARLFGPVLLSPTATLDPDVAEYVCRMPSVAGYFVYGGPNAIADPVAEELAARILGEGC